MVTPYAVEGEVDYDRLLAEFGADPLTDDQADRFPDTPLVRRRIFYAGRDVDRYLDAAAAGRPHSIVTGRGPSGPMHLGHVLPFYFAKRLQDATGATVYVPLSDDEKYFAKDLSFEAVGAAARENLRDLLAVGFDPERTRFVVDTADADVVYPVAARVAKYLTPATVEATYGDPPNVGLGFYPAVQATHLLLPQLVDGEHPTLVPTAVDQDPHVRVCRDVAGTEHLPVSKPGALLGKFFPGPSGPGKMSTSDDAPSILLTDDPETVERKVRTHAYSGGRTDLAAHREHGGDPTVDVAFQFLRFFFEPDDDELDRIAREYRDGSLLSGEMKGLAIDRITEFLADHQRRRAALGDLEEELDPFRLTDGERSRALRRSGVPSIP
ncbi:tryptophan--tRNA ligase [Halobacteriales archaeon QS_8_69_26]|nr:MAG: tryptophan--tRNA ligase [Halobacteriales archaeon QS_8_69_26]